MPNFEHQQDYDKVVQMLGASTKPKRVTRTKSRPQPTKPQCREHLQGPVPFYKPPIDASYRQWELKDSKLQSLSPVRLLLLFFQPILDLLVYHTNMNAQCDSTRKEAWQDVTDTEIRRWLACRLEIPTVVPPTRDLQYFWSTNARATVHLSCGRFKTIERYLSLNSASQQSLATDQLPQWFWKVQLALDAVRDRFRALLIPSSNICVDESTIKFHGRKLDVHRLDHKPAKRGFVVYALTSDGGLMHDFVVSSSQDGLEGVPEGITIELPTRATRKRKRSETGMTATEIHLPPIKAMVYKLCKRVTTEYRSQQHICFMDNLFVDVHVAKALLLLNIGICGTTRKNAPGIPPVLAEIQYTYPELLPPDGVTSCIVDKLVNVTTWHDSLRDNIVTFITTVYRPHSTALTKRKSKHLHGTRTTLAGFSIVLARQPEVAVAYNKWMGPTDNANHLRVTATIRRPGQLKWTKKFIEFIVDICQVNAYIIWKRNPQNQQLGHRERKAFISELIEGLLYDQDNVHIPSSGKTRKHCRWRGCRPREYNRRQPLQEVTNLATPSRSCLTWDYCTRCTRCLCISKGCWAAYHKARHLPIRPEDDRVGYGVDGR